ncbi:MAG TPA: hypothetical protein VM536_21740 [Chloroflexia bacterium]|nr:hypothetical protein [Chloroflexia bacterium]
MMRRRQPDDTVGEAPTPAPAPRGRGTLRPATPRRQLNGFVALNIAISLITGGLVLFGFLVPGANVLVRLFGSWTTTIIIFALLLGFFNLLRVHVGRIVARGAGWPYSAALVLSALLVLGLGFLGSGSVGDPLVQWVFTWVYQPIGSSLFALLAFLLAGAAFRTLRAGPSAAWVLLAVALLVIVGNAPWSRDPPLSLLAGAKDWIVNYPALAGLRGIMLGAALGAIATSLRVLLGMDRPYLS